MIPGHSKNKRVISQFKTTCIGLGLARLQIDMGLAEEARRTLASLQDDFQLLLHGLQDRMETVPMKSDAGMDANRSPGKHDSLTLTEELLAVHT